MDRTDTIPQLQNIEFDTDHLVHVIGEDGQLVLLHDPETIRTEDRTIEDARFVSSYAVIDESPEDVREYVRNFDQYEDLLKSVRSSTTTRTDKESPRAEFVIGLDTPVVNPSFRYELEYESEDGTLFFRSLEGDFDLILGCWEFIPLPQNRTLLAYTSWFEFGSLSWTLQTIFWAQPDLETTIPVTQSAILLRALKNGLENRDSSGPTEPVDRLPEDPETPFFTDQSEDLVSLVPLAERGTVMKVHPQQWIRDEGSPLEVTYVSGIGLMDRPFEEAQAFTTDFERYADFIQQVGRVETREEGNGEIIGTWMLDLGINVLSIGLDYTLRYTPVSEKALSFRRIEGDIQYVSGALEWEPVGDHRTLFFYTTATQVGSGDSFIVKMANILPHKQIVIGVAAGAMAVEKLVDAAEDRR
jgi:ribosome-associated toxin RatA of RatAB toxin-antitoxin module